MQTKSCLFCEEVVPALSKVCFNCGRDQPDPEGQQGSAYWRELLDALRDFEIDSEESERLQVLREAEGLSLEQVKALHAGAASWFLSQYALDGVVDSGETINLRFLWASLSALGWAPGE